MIAADLRHMTARWHRPAWYVVARAALMAPMYPQIEAMLWVRTSMWLWRHHLRIVAQWCKARAVRRAGVEVHPAAEIGPGFALMHAVGIVIGKHVVAGSDLVCYQGVTIGDRDPLEGQPRIGSKVRIGAGAVLLGPITIGSGARIGANAVVLADVPAGRTVVGVWK